MSDAIEVGDDAANGPLSVVVTRRIQPGCDKPTRSSCRAFYEAIKGFDGYLGSRILRQRRLWTTI